MKAKTTKILFASMALAGMAGFSGTASADFDLTNCGFTGINTNFDGSANTTLSACPWVQYGDALSYNLAVNSSLYDATFGGGTGPSNPFYVKSTPGEIKDLVVNATGADGNPVVTNYDGMDNAYPTPNSDGSVFFTTNKDAYGYKSDTDPYTITAPAGVMAPADPGDDEGQGKLKDTFTRDVEFVGDSVNTWDASLTALAGYLGDGVAPIFFFNNNQTNRTSKGETGNDTQSLAVWAMITLTGEDEKGNPITAFFEFTNMGGSFFVTPLGGGVFLGDAGDFDSDGSGPNAGTNAETDYVLAGGKTCYDSTTGGLTLPTGNSCPDGTTFVNSNLGANQAAYAVLFPELNAILLSENFGGFSTMSLDLRMGCDPNTVGVQTGTNGSTTFNFDTANCTARSLNNGYEQLFIGRIVGTTVQVPEPATVALLGMGLLGLGLARRRKTA